MMRISSAYFVNDAGGGCSNAEGRETFDLTTQKCRFMGKEVREISRVFAPAVLRVSRTSLPTNLHSLVLLDLDRRADNFLRHIESLKRVCPRLRELARGQRQPSRGITQPRTHLFEGLCTNLCYRMLCECEHFCSPAAANRPTSKLSLVRPSSNREHNR